MNARDQLTRSSEMGIFRIFPKTNPTETFFRRMERSRDQKNSANCRGVQALDDWLKSFWKTLRNEWAPRIQKWCRVLYSCIWRPVPQKTGSGFVLKKTVFFENQPKETENKTFLRTQVCCCVCPMVPTTMFHCIFWAVVRKPRQPKIFCGKYLHTWGSCCVH